MLRCLWCQSSASAAGQMLHLCRLHGMFRHGRQHVRVSIAIAMLHTVNHRPAHRLCNEQADGQAGPTFQHQKRRILLHLYVSATCHSWSCLASRNAVPAQFAWTTSAADVARCAHLELGARRRHIEGLERVGQGREGASGTSHVVPQPEDRGLLQAAAGAEARGRSGRTDVKTYTCAREGPGPMWTECAQKVPSRLSM